MAKPTKNYSKNFSSPDETRPFQSHGHLDIVELEGEKAIGRAVFEPGWTWMNDVRPIMGSNSCQAEHLGHCTKGAMTIRMDDGDQFTIHAGEAFHIPPGHLAWVEGNESCEMVDMIGFERYAKKAA